jgi:hypothetical protein
MSLCPTDEIQYNHQVHTKITNIKFSFVVAIDSGNMNGFL